MKKENQTLKQCYLCIFFLIILKEKVWLKIFIMINKNLKTILMKLNKKLINHKNSIFY